MKFQVFELLSYYDCVACLVAVALDRFSKCGATVTYRGKRAVSAVGRTVSSYSRKPVSNGESCDLFSGKWVFDNNSYPLYNESDCPYMSNQLACRRHGRPDLGYQFWRWQPNNCNLKRYLYF